MSVSSALTHHYRRAIALKHCKINIKNGNHYAKKQKNCSLLTDNY